MADYIDLDTPLEVYIDRGGLCRQQITTLRELLDVNRIPYTTADVVPVKHGRWTLHKDGSATCSVCKFVQNSAWDLDNWDNYCHHCGALMDGGQKE